MVLMVQQLIATIYSIATAATPRPGTSYIWYILRTYMVLLVAIYIYIIVVQLVQDGISGTAGFCALVFCMSIHQHLCSYRSQWAVSAT